MLTPFVPFRGQFSKVQSGKTGPAPRPVLCAEVHRALNGLGSGQTLDSLSARGAEKERTLIDSLQALYQYVYYYHHCYYYYYYCYEHYYYYH